MEGHGRTIDAERLQAVPYAACCINSPVVNATKSRSPYAANRGVFGNLAHCELGPLVEWEAIL